MSLPLTCVGITQSGRVPSRVIAVAQRSTDLALGTDRRFGAHRSLGSSSRRRDRAGNGRPRDDGSDAGMEDPLLDVSALRLWEAVPYQGCTREYWGKLSSTSAVMRMLVTAAARLAYLPVVPRHDCHEMSMHHMGLDTSRRQGLSRCRVLAPHASYDRCRPPRTVGIGVMDYCGTESSTGDRRTKFAPPTLRR